MSKGWFKRSSKMTADAARRITGISVPFGGIQWSDPGPSDAQHVRQFFLFLEDRRVLYNPEILEVESEVHRSIHDIRAECTRILQQLGPSAFAIRPVRMIRAACRSFHDEETQDFRLFGGWQRGHDPHAGFLAALGGFRAAVGLQVALLAAYYDIDIEGDLARVLPAADDDQD